MTTKVTYFDAKVNNTESYGTHINIEIGMKLEEEQSVQYLLTVTKSGCQIKRVDVERGGNGPASEEGERDE